MNDQDKAILDLLGRHKGGLSVKRAARLLGIDQRDLRAFRRQVLQMFRAGLLRKHRERFLLCRGPGDLGEPPAENIRAGKRREAPWRKYRERSIRRGERRASFAPQSVTVERSIGMKELLEEYDLPTGFNKRVMREADEAVNRKPAATDRLDLRSILTITIDPADARDHDDAVSLELLPDGGRRLGVHIADVSEFVTVGSALDREAFRRANSTYFYLDTIPMLPPILSGQHCSLLESEERSALSVLIDYDGEGRVVQSTFAETLVQIDAGFSYERAEELIGGECEEGTPEAAALREMLTLFRQLKEQRRGEGALQFELPETVPVDRGEGVEGFEPAAILTSHGLVEEFMLAANHEVGHLFRVKGVPTPYRIHEPPKGEDLEGLTGFLAQRDIKWSPGSEGIRSVDFQELARRFDGRPDRLSLLYRMLRAMQKACYSPEDLGHFGLAWSDYLHFTSPIRRYADLMVHRELKRLIRSRRGTMALVLKQKERHREGSPRRETASRDYSYLSPEKRRGGRYTLKDVARWLSERELNSVQAERQGARLEMVLWARQHLGESFSARIESVFPTGVLLHLHESGVEGFLPASQLGNEYFLHLEEREEMRGERTGKVFRVGTEVQVKLVDANLFLRRIQFLLEELPQAGETTAEC